MEKKELLTNLNELNKEIYNLRDNLNKIDEEKEFWFDKKEKLRKEISRLVIDVKDIKHIKDDANVEIKKLKEQRENYNKKVRELIAKIKELNKSKIEFIKKNKVEVDPELVKREIDRLEFRIETEALSMNKEKSLMKKIKDLKKVYEKNIELKNIIDEMNEVDKEIKYNKIKSDQVHKKIKELINKSDPGYAKFKEESTKINELRKEQQNAFDRFISLKNEFLKVQEGLQEKLKENMALC